MSPEETPDTSGNGDTKGTSVIVNAIAVLRCFTADEPLLGVTEIASRVGLHKSTVSRILATFEQEHLVERDPETRSLPPGPGADRRGRPPARRTRGTARGLPGPARTHRTDRRNQRAHGLERHRIDVRGTDRQPPADQTQHPAGGPVPGRHERLLQVSAAAEPPRRLRRPVRSPPSPTRGWTMPAWTATRSSLATWPAGAGPSTTVNHPSTK